MEFLAYYLALASVVALVSLFLAPMVIDAGHVSFAHGAFLGLGAYVWAGRAALADSGWTLAAAGAGLVALPVVLGVLLSRLSPDEFVLLTLASQVSMVQVARNWQEVTRGNLGMSVPRVDGLASGSWALVMLLIVAVGAAAACLARLRSSSAGLYLRVVRDDAVLASSLGVRVSLVKGLVFAATSLGAVIVGAGYGQAVGFIHPDGFSLEMSLLVVCVVIVGERWGAWGVVLGAFTLVGLSECFRFLPLPDAAKGPVRQILYATLLALSASWRPSWRGFAYPGGTK